MLHVSDTYKFVVIINTNVIDEQPQTIRKYEGCTTRTGAEISAKLLNIQELITV